MEQMDIYMRRRLVALGGLIGFFIIFILLVKSCGGDDEPQPTASTTQTGASGVTGSTALPIDEYIAQADAICEEANDAVGSLDPSDPDATAQELRITTGEQEQLQQLEPEQVDRDLRTFLGSLRDLVDALESKTVALDNGDTVAADEAQVAIDEAEVEARGAGEDFGFNDCGQFLDAGQGPGESESGAAVPDSGAVAPVAPSGGVAPTTPAPTTPAPAAPAPAEPAPTDPSGGIAP